MKKVSILIFSLLLISSLISCGNKSIYKDGIYIGKGEYYSEGYDDVTVNIESGKIVDLVIRHLDMNGKEIDYSKWNGKDKPNVQQYRADVTREVLNKQSGDIDLIDKIYNMSSNWKIAINDALEKAKK